jgi:ubiquinone/menaquinone biosynthesis C-methylase UbiE
MTKPLPRIRPDIDSAAQSSMPKPADTRWSREGPGQDGERLREHLQSVHDTAAGFTEDCASACRDGAGRNTYEWLCEAASPRRGEAVLDLACGSGALLELCRARYAPGVQLVGVDMSAAELALARTRLGGGVRLHKGLAQSLDFAADTGFHGVLCHWALTVMDPVDPVLAEIRRVLVPGGVFAAIVDGPAGLAQGYAEVSAIIEAHVRAARPAYGELGDPRVRRCEDLQALAEEAFPDAHIEIESGVFVLEGPPARLAREASGFFYSAFVLDEVQRTAMLAALERHFSAAERTRFEMPVNRLIAVL